jgi:hypothetical protein
MPLLRWKQKPRNRTRVRRAFNPLPNFNTTNKPVNSVRHVAYSIFHRKPELKIVEKAARSALLTMTLEQELRQIFENQNLVTTWYNELSGPFDENSLVTLLERSYQLNGLLRAAQLQGNKSQQLAKIVLEKLFTNPKVKALSENQRKIVISELEDVWAVLKTLYKDKIYLEQLKHKALKNWSQKKEDKT